VSDHNMDEAEPAPIPDMSVQPDLPPSPVAASPPSRYVALPASSFGRRRRQPLPRHPDMIPSEGMYIEGIDPPPPPPSPPERSEEIQAPSVTVHINPNEARTEPDHFGVYRVYPRFPTQNPDDEISPSSFCDAPSHAVTTSEPLNNPESTFTNPWAPFSNWSRSLLMRWFLRRKRTLTINDLDVLVQDVLLDDKFTLDELSDPPFSTRTELRLLDDSTRFQAKDGWKTGDIELAVPCEDCNFTEKTAPRFTVTGVQYRRLIPTIRAACAEASAKLWHLTPFRAFYLPTPDAEPQPVESEVYSSKLINDEYVKLQNDEEIKKRHPGYEIVVLAMMIWSDATQLANFGTASLWPIYLFFGNMSKYIRDKPSSMAAHHLAYIPSVSQISMHAGIWTLIVSQLPDAFQDWYKEVFGKAPTAEVLKFLRYGLFNNMWEMLMDAEFIAAYKDGFLAKFADGITRLVFPRFFSYSADYPEK
jgi:hypothetical protein